MGTGHPHSPELREQFASAVASLDQRYAADATIMADENQDATVRS